MADFGLRFDRRYNGGGARLDRALKTCTAGRAAPKDDAAAAGRYLAATL